LKRTFDLIVAALTLTCSLPVLLVSAVAIKLDSRGPVFYRPPRVGRDGRLFRIWKLRTMLAKAPDGPPVTAADDPRITRVGRFLRRTKLDEIPQVLNVLRGEMSLVGPRPEDPVYVAGYTPEQRRVLSVRPGMTSPASLAFSDEERLLATGRRDAAYATTILPVKLDLDLVYLQRRSFLYDLTILARTAGLLFPRHFVTMRRLSSFVRRRVPWALIDAVVVAAAFYAAFALRVLDVSGRDLADILATLNALIVPLVILYASVNYLFGLHRRVWRYASGAEVVAILAAAGTSTAIVMAVRVLAILRDWPFIPTGLILLGGFFSFSGLVAMRYRWRLLPGASRAWPSRGPRTRALIYGAGEAGQLLAWRLLTRREGRAYRIVGFIDDDRNKRGLRIHGIEVLGGRSSLARNVDRYRIDLIILAINNISGEKLRAIVSVAQETPAQIKIAPSMFDWIARPNGTPLVREVRLEDLLGRPRASLDRAACQRVLGDKIVLVTGACGSIGAELCRTIASVGPARLVAMDNNETGLYDLEIGMRAAFPGLDLAVAVGDVTDALKMAALFAEFRPQVIFHVAAYKHVPLMEIYPEEAVRVNVRGTWVTLAQARQWGAERFVLVSTDKAVNPSSVMGATKRIAEMLVIGDVSYLPEARRGDRLVCTAVRFGNVIGTRGSVIPTFARQIELGGPLTVTHPDMTRYFMELSEAAGLIVEAAALTEGRDIFMLDMGERIRIDDLARKMIRMRGLRPGIDIPIVYTGVRPGEKLHEELTYSEEEKVPTEHPLIHRVSDRHQVDGAALREAVQDLLRLAAAGKRDLLVRELLRVSRSGAVPDAVGVASS